MERIDRAVLHHAVQGEDHDTGIGASPVHQAPDGTIDRDRHLTHGVVEFLALTLSDRAEGAPMAPHLVAGAVQAAKAQNE